MLKTAASVLALTFVLQASPGLAQQLAAPASAAAQAEDARLAAFFDKAFEDQTALSPESQTYLGRKTNYGKLDDYTEAGGKRRLDLAEAQLAEMKRSFEFDKLSPASQLSWRLFADSVEQGRGVLQVALARLQRLHRGHDRRRPAGAADQRPPSRHRRRR